MLKMDTLSYRNKTINEKFSIALLIIQYGYLLIAYLVLDTAAINAFFVKRTNVKSITRNAIEITFIFGIWLALLDLIKFIFPTFNVEKSQHNANDKHDKSIYEPVISRSVLFQVHNIPFF